MKIIVLDYEKQILQVEFTDTELKHPLFSSTLSRMRNQDGFTVHKSGELVSVTVIDDDTYQTVGIAVDDIRELWMGDVIPPKKDEKGNIIPKDLSKCPQFDFTPEPVPKQDPLGVGKDESGIQKPVSELDKSTL